MNPRTSKGMAMIELIIMLLSAMTAGGMAGSQGLNSTSYKQVAQEMETGNATPGLEYIQEAADELKDTVSTDIMVMSMWESKEGDLTVVIQNTGQKEINTSKFTLIPLNRRPGDGNCFKAENSTMLAPEESYRCDSGVDFPKVYKRAKFRIILDGTSKSWKFSCQPRTSATTFC